MAFIEHKFSGDPTNWWVPNHAGIEAMLRSSGLRVDTRPAEEIYVCVPSPETAAWKWDTQLQSVLGTEGPAAAAVAAQQPEAANA
jgi:tRNA (mo5U34)-methyltransferase